VKTIQEMRAQIAKLQEMINREDTSDLERIKGLQKDPKFEFYDELSTKKEAATQKGKSPPAEAPAGSEPDEGASSAERSERFTLQVASLEREVDAIKMVNRLVERKYPAYYYRARVNERTYFRVRCGSFKTREEADAFGRLLAEKESIKGFVTQAEK
jgi:cell division septation protein DedD